MEVDESPPSEEEVLKSIRSFKNNKSSGTDYVPAEALKYQTSKNLTIALVLLLSLIWSTVTVSAKWLESCITCLYKKGSKSLPENYRALSVGANLSKILPKIILSRIQKSHEHNISEA